MILCHGKKSSKKYVKYHNKTIFVDIRDTINPDIHIDNKNIKYKTGENIGFGDSSPSSVLYINNKGPIGIGTIHPKYNLEVIKNKYYLKYNKNWLRS